MFLQSPAYLVISLLPLSMVEIAPEFKPALLTDNSNEPNVVLPVPFTGSIFSVRLEAVD